jgi:hypothetical protein
MTERTWITDDNGNRCSVEYWGSEEAAKAALASLEDCSRCSDCSYCSDCSRCSRCSYCSRCSCCSCCSDCSDMAPQKAAFAVPVIEDIHRKLYEAVSQPNALNMAHWHACDTTHCRAGWVVHLAGEPGYELEKRTSALFAAQQIYKASGYEISPVRFFDDNGTAMADMKRLAEA